MRLLPTRGLTEQEKPLRQADAGFSKAQELRTFLFLTVVTAPVLAGAIVAGWGFLVWMYQLLFAGPPGS